jgi:hypothetical protein
MGEHQREHIKRSFVEMTELQMQQRKKVRHREID